MDDLVTWLGAQLDERARTAEEMRGAAEDVARLWGHDDPPEGDMNAADRIWFYVQDEAARVLAEVEAKRAILDLHQNVNDGNCGTCVDGQWGYPTHGGSIPQSWPCRTIRAVALPYRDRPGWRLEWAPEPVA